MEIFIARPCGFCFGAKRSVDIANNAGKAYSLGNILHNENLVEQLRQKGLEPLEFNELIKKKPCKVIIRAHGAPFSQLQALREKGFEVIDATCTNVKKIYDAALGSEMQGYPAYIYGDRSHPEVIGIASRLKNPVIIGSISEIPENLPEKLCLVSQTTKLKQDYEKIRDLIQLKCREVKAFDTICPSTEEMQKAAFLAAGRSDAMVVIGGKDSSNTKRLFEVCKSANPNTFLIQSKSDLNKQLFSGAEKIGITAGASTPDFVINETAEELRGWTKKN